MGCDVQAAPAPLTASAAATFSCPWPGRAPPCFFLPLRTSLEQSHWRSSCLPRPRQKLSPPIRAGHPPSLSSVLAQPFKKYNRDRFGTATTQVAAEAGADFPSGGGRRGDAARGGQEGTAHAKTCKAVVKSEKEIEEAIKFIGQSSQSAKAAAAWSASASVRSLRRSRTSISSRSESSMAAPQ